MKLLLDSSKLREFVGARLGVLVSLSSPPEDGSEVVVVVGLCAAVEDEKKPNSDLKDCGLPIPDWGSTVESVRQHYPAGCSALGVWVKVQEEELNSAVSLLIEKTKLRDAFNGPVLVVSCDPDETTPPVVKAYTCSAPTSSPFELTPVECMKPSDMTVGRYLSQQTAMLRVCGSLPLCLTTTTDIAGPIGKLILKIQSQSSVFLLSTRQVLFDETSSQKLKTVLSERFKVSSKSGSSSAGSMAHIQGKPVMVDLLESTVAELTTELPVAPTLTLSKPLKEGCVQLSLPVDSLGLVRWDATLGEVAECLKASICAQLEAIKKEMTWKANMFHSISIHHFSLPTQDTPVTIAYPDTPLAQNGEKLPTSLTNQQLQPRQTVWRGMFGLSPKNSQLRILSRSPVGTDLDWIASTNIRCQGPQLLNPHLTVKCTGVVGGTRRVVQGSYLYYHYTQDGFDDTGWGCAYRSLQTLWSWFLLQGYTEKPVPGHREIQETLVRVGDKEQTFLGSKEWIGSFEVSTVLNQLLGVESKIHYTSSGAEMVSAGRVLLNHFLTEGTPVMIGGGVLAQTILGVDFCTASGEIQFLVLDPHFTGRDELKTVLEKGMCAWRLVKFWDSTAHYNMCLPLVPNAA